MKSHLVYLPVANDALNHAADYRQASGISITQHGSDIVTDLLLPIPSVQPDGAPFGLRQISDFLAGIPENVTIIGGHLNVALPSCYSTLDLLKSEDYLAQNAAITAECALQIAAVSLPITFWRTPVLILGSGRIAQCLCRLLSTLGAEVTLAARRNNARAMAAVVGCKGISLTELAPELGQYRLLFNTIPAMVLPTELAARCRTDCVKIDLASVIGIAGDNVIRARGLPGKLAPESSGRLIAETICTYFSEEEGSL